MLSLCSLCHHSSRLEWKNYLFDVLWMFLQELLEGVETVAEALGVIQPIDAQDDLAGRVAHHPRGLFRQLLESSQPNEIIK